MANTNWDFFRKCAIWVLGGFAGLCFSGFFFLASTDNANAKDNTTEHTTIRKEVKQSEDTLRKELTAVVKDFRMEQMALKDEMSKGFSEVLVQIAELK